MKQQTKETIIIAGVAIAVAALGFVGGVLFATRKKKRLVVTAKGELVKQEVSEDS